MTAQAHDIAEVVHHTPTKVEIVCTCGHSVTSIRYPAKETAQGLFRSHQAVAPHDDRRAAERSESEAG